jgi:hypothetical protein
MTGPGQRAFSYGAEGHKETAFNPATADKCFLCGNSVGETDPRQFWSPPGASAMMLGHTACIRKFEANGNQWPDSENHLLDEQSSLAQATQYQATHPAPVEEQDTGIIASEIKASNVRFDNFTDMQNFVRAHGSIPPSANVFIGELQVQHAQ